MALLKGNKTKSKTKVKIYSQKKSQKDNEINIINKLKERYEIINSQEIKKFSDFPLSSKTIKGLRDCGYHKPTEIQREAIGLALNGKDILGAAQTGSGKTLAFLIPILERLYVNQWTKLDGLGALIITPTRELAYQIFETLSKVGAQHDFSAGLIIGGKDLKFETSRLDQCNIMICTPGRLLQHMDENPLFDCVNMKILVLDEADRCLDMGFEKTMNAIIANLPPKRQTLLFSATQTKSVKDLVRLSLVDPCYISVHETSEFGTPKELNQSYAVVDLKDKVSVLWSFLKNHPNKKIIVFLSSCKQVKYIYEIFCKLRPGNSLMALYGTLHQLRRMDIYDNFCRKQSAILIATDIAARGLDFPEVHWVVQVDAPEDVETYIHRVGRTARYHRGGESLLMVLPSEIEMVNKLVQKKIPIQKIEINPLKLTNPIRKMEAFLAKNPSLKDSAQRAFVSYLKSVFLMKDKTVFDIQSLDTDSFAHSLGLAIPPRIRFLQKFNARKELHKQSSNFAQSNNQNNKKIFSSDGEDENEDKTDKECNIDGITDLNKANRSYDEDDDSDVDILKIKRKDHDIDFPVEDIPEEPKKNKKRVTKAALVKKILRKNIKPNTKIVFDEDGEAVTMGTKEKKSDMAIRYEQENVAGIDIEKAKMVLKEEDKFDKQLFKEKVKAKHKETKRKLKKNKSKKEQSEDFDESESEAEPDVSWLPDPDKIYGNQKAEHDSDTIPSSDGLKKNKRKKKKEENSISKKKRKLEKLSNNLSVNEAEQLALMLLEK